METQQLARRQSALQREANDVRTRRHLDDLLRTAGEPVLVGGTALGLIVWEDLDLTVICDSLDPECVLEIGRSLACHPDVRTLTFRNDMGRWNSQPDRYPDGLYLGVRYQREEVHPGPGGLCGVGRSDGPGRLRHDQTEAGYARPGTRPIVRTAARVRRAPQ